MGAFKKIAIDALNNAHLSRFSNGSSATALDLANYADHLGGEVDGRYIVCPSPGKGVRDRSLYVLMTSATTFFIYDCEGPKRDAIDYVLRPAIPSCRKTSSLTSPRCSEKS
jgi:hypothetical protein